MKANTKTQEKIPYKVYKVCPLLLRRLWTLSRVVLRKGKIPSCWQVAEEIFNPKERCKRHYTVQNNITAECGRQDILLCTCQEPDKVYDRQQLC